MQVRHSCNYFSPVPTGPQCALTFTRTPNPYNSLSRSSMSHHSPNYLANSICQHWAEFQGRGGMYYLDYYTFKIFQVWRKLTLTWNWQDMENLQLNRKCWQSQKQAHWLQPGSRAVSVASRPDLGHVTPYPASLPARLTFRKSRAWRKHTGWCPTP